MIRKNAVTNLFLPILLTCTCLVVSSTIALAQEPQALKYSDGTEEYRYLFYTPEKTQKSTALLIYLHGTSAKGNSLDSLKKGGISKLISDGKKLPCYVAAPQVGYNQKWSVSMVDKLISNITSRYSIDMNRIYLIGLSSGGAIAMEYTCKHPEKIACVVTISSWGNPQEVCKMKDVPAWLFHAQDDKAVSITGSKALTEALYLCRGNVRLTEFPDGGHNIWEKSLKYPELFDWILTRRKNEASKTVQRIQLDQTTVGYKIPKALNNVAGIWSSPTGRLFGINGKRSAPVILNFDTLGRVEKMTFVSNAANLNWQDITPDQEGNLYIADIGNDNFKREHFQLYKLKEEDLISKEKVIAQKIDFKVTKGSSFHYMASFYHKQHLYIIGESHTNSEKFLVEIPVNEGDSVEATIVGNCNSLMPGSITSAYYDSSQNTLFLLTKSMLGFLTLDDGIKTITEKKATQIKLPYSSQKEALTMMPNGYLAYADKLFLGTSDGNFYIRRYP